MERMLFSERKELLSHSEEIFYLVASNATPKQWTDWLRPAMEHAAAEGNLRLVTMLLQAGATGAPGPRGCRGRTLLDAAAEGGNADVVSALLRSGAKHDVLVRSGSKRRSALHRAAVAGHDAATLRLMMAGANVYSLDADRRSPLHLAVRAGHEQVVSSLLLGLTNDNVNAKDKRGDTALHLAAYRGHPGITCALLLRGAEKNALDGQGRSPLHVAAEGGHPTTVEALIEAGADYSLRYGENELSVLDSSASSGHIEVLKTLLQHGADVNDADSTGYTALHMAADNNAAAAVNVLIRAGANVESLDIHNWTPLHCAARYNGCGEAMVALLQNGANVRARETAGEQPLHVAALYRADRAVDILLRWGADETAVNEDGYTPVENIGAYAISEDETTAQEQTEEADRIRRLLLGAPADRAWRRRGCLVLCRCRYLSRASSVTRGRAYHDRILCEEEFTALTRTDLDEDAQRQATACRPRKRVAREFVEASSAETGACAECFYDACWRVMQLNEEGLFRAIIAFL